MRFTPRLHLIYAYLHCGGPTASPTSCDSLHVYAYVHCSAQALPSLASFLWREPAVGEGAAGLRHGALRAQEYTNYHFDCKPDALRGGLERFSQFFIAPLCKADALEREVCAVDNEFSGAGGPQPRARIRHR